MAELLRALSERRARRAFAATPVPDEFMELLWRAVSVAPSHGNAQPVRILLPSSGEQRAQLVEALSEGNRSWAHAAPALCALGALPEHERRVVDIDGSEREMWAFHAGIAMGNLMAQATELGLIAHPMAGFEEARVRAVFGAPERLKALVVIAIGFPGEAEALPDDLRARETRDHERLALDRLVVRGVWTDAHGASAQSLREEHRER